MRLRYGVFAAVLRRLPRGLARSRRRLIAVAACSYLDVKFQARFLTAAMAACGSPRGSLWNFAYRSEPSERKILKFQAAICDPCAVPTDRPSIRRIAGLRVALALNFKIPSTILRGSPQNFTRRFCGRLHRPRHKLSRRLRTDRLGLEF